MKIMIVGSPKTGNMWLKHMLADIYDLEAVDLWDVPNMRDHLVMPRFVAHQHFLPRPGVLRWADEIDMRYVTMARHPGDLFLSLYHYVQNYADKWRAEGRLGHTPSHRMAGAPLDSAAVHDYLENHFLDECLGKTLAWVESGRAPLVRYEDLHRDPVAAVSALCTHWQPVERERVQRAAERFQFGNMRAIAGPGMKRHFRRGAVGTWASELGAGHLTILERTHAEPMRRFDYHLDPTRAAVREPVPLGGGEDRWYRRAGKAIRRRLRRATGA